jgi:hypothetical protein
VSEALRTVVVRPDNGARESYWVLQAIVVIAIGSTLAAASRRAPPGTPESLALYQKLFREQPGPVQRVYRDLVSGLEDAMRLRTPKDGWPSVETLRAEFVPPFRGNGELRWELRRKAGIVNYLGVPKEGSPSPAFLLLIQENIPHPGTPVLDEFHRKAPDGSLLHVGIWIHSAAPSVSEVLVVPERQGWTEIVTGAPPAETK